MSDQRAEELVEVELSSLNQIAFVDKRASKWFDESRIAYLRTHFNDIDPIVVFEDINGERNVASGFHRVETAHRMGIPSILALLKAGSKWDAANFPDFGKRIRWSDL